MLSHRYIFIRTDLLFCANTLNTQGFSVFLLFCRDVYDAGGGRYSSGLSDRAINRHGRGIYWLYYAWFVSRDIFQENDGSVDLLNTRPLWAEFPLAGYITEM